MQRSEQRNNSLGRSSSRSGSNMSDEAVRSVSPHLDIGGSRHGPGPSIDLDTPAHQRSKERSASLRSREHSSKTARDSPLGGPNSSPYYRGRHPPERHHWRHSPIPRRRHRTPCQKSAGMQHSPSANSSDRSSSVRKSRVRSGSRRQRRRSPSIDRRKRDRRHLHRRRLEGARSRSRRSSSRYRSSRSSSGARRRRPTHDYFADLQRHKTTNRKDKDDDSRYIESEVRKRTKAAIEQRVIEELERRKPSIEAEIREKVNAEKTRIYNELKAELEVWRTEERKKMFQREEEERQKREELEKIIAENNRKIEEQHRRMAEEHLKLLDEQRKLVEQKERIEAEQKRRETEEQALILGKRGTRPKLSFQLGQR